MANALLSGSNGHFAAQGGANGTSAAGNIDTTGATCLWMGTSYLAGVAPTVSDSKGNSWAPVIAAVEGTIQGVALYLADNPVVGSAHTFSATGTGCYASLAVIAASGVSVSSPQDQANSAYHTGTEALQTGSVTPSEDGEILVTVAGVYDRAAGLGIDSSFSISDDLQILPGVNFDIGMAYKIQTTATSENPNWSWSGSSYAHLLIGSFKEQGVGGTDGALDATESTDTCAVGAANWQTAQLGATESTDTAAAVAANWRTADLAAVESTDTAALGASVTTGAALACAESPDACAIIGEGNASITTSAIDATESPDTAAVAASVTTGGAVQAGESSDTTVIAGQATRPASIGATESSDTTAIATSGTDTSPVRPRPTVGGFFVGPYSPPPERFEELPPLLARMGCTESADKCVVYTVNDRTGPLQSIDDIIERANADAAALRLRLAAAEQLEREDLELLLDC